MFNDITELPKFEDIDYDDPQDMKLFMGQFIKGRSGNKYLKIIDFELHGYYKHYFFKFLNIMDGSEFIMNLPYAHGYQWIDKSEGETLHRNNKLKNILT